jgi:uncharacterized membrane protein
MKKRIWNIIEIIISLIFGTGSMYMLGVYSSCIIYEIREIPKNHIMIVFIIGLFFLFYGFYKLYELILKRKSFEDLHRFIGKYGGISDEAEYNYWKCKYFEYKKYGRL